MREEISGMIHGIGIDIIEISRIKKDILRSNGTFLKRIFTNFEINYCEVQKNKYQHYSARFAGKEGILKAIGLGWCNGIDWRDIEIRNNKLGAPVVKLYGKAKQLIKETGVKNIWITLSHSSKYALSQVILED